TTPALMLLPPTSTPTKKRGDCMASILAYQLPQVTLSLSPVPSNFTLFHPHDTMISLPTSLEERQCSFSMGPTRFRLRISWPTGWINRRGKQLLEEQGQIQKGSRSPTGSETHGIGRAGERWSVWETRTGE